MVLSGIVAFAVPFVPAVAVTGAAAVTGWLGCFSSVGVVGVVVVVPEDELPPPFRQYHWIAL